MITEKEYRNTCPNLTQYKTFVIPLKTIIRDQSLIPKVNNLAIKLNDIVKSAYQFIKCYVLYCYKNKISYEINSKFIYRCITVLGFTQSQRKQDNITRFYENEFQPIYNHVLTSHKLLDHFFSDIVVEMNACIKTNIQEHFIQHFLRFINKTTENITTDKKILHQFKHELLNFNGNNNPIFNQWKSVHLPNIITFFVDPIKLISINYDVKVNTQNYLNGMLYMNLILGSLGYKLFEPIPQRTSNVPKQFLMCSASLIGYFNDVSINIGKTNAMKAVNNNRFECWSNFLKFNHKIFKSKNYTFAFQIRTDGISCGLVFVRRDLFNQLGNISEVESSKEYKKLEDMTNKELNYAREKVNIVGCDPGKSNLVSMVDSYGNKLSYTAVQRRFESKIPKCEKILKKLKERYCINKLEVPFSTINLSTANYDSYKFSLHIKHNVDQQTKTFYDHELWRKMRLRRFIYGRKSVDKFTNKIGIKFGKFCIIPYGDWSRSTQMRYFKPTMGRKLRRLIHRKYITITTNEAYTTKKCCDCLNDIEKYKFKTPKLILPKRSVITKSGETKKTSPKKIRFTEGEEVRGLLICPHCVKPNLDKVSVSEYVSSKNKYTIFKNRDVNGATNIMKLAKYYMINRERPNEFCYNSQSSQRDMSFIHLWSKLDTHRNCRF
jgi:hypothetical protein